VGGVTSGGPLADTVRGLAARNRLLCLVRNAPLGVVATQLRRPQPGGPVPGLARAVAVRLPTALADRARLARRRSRSRAEIWDRWAGVDETWGEPA
jgi:hypothetical protein